MATHNNDADKPLLLRPRTSELVDRFLADRGLVRQISTACGSPVNVLFPGALKGNVNEFHMVLAKHRLNARIFFAHKATRSRSLVSQLAHQSVSVDVASLGELRHALSCGFDGSRLEATGPKNDEFLRLCLLHNGVINVDSLDELRRVAQLKRILSLKRKCKILIRLSGFGGFGSQILHKSSRFGVLFSEANEVFAALEEFKEDLLLLGFSFHLDTIGVPERLVAIENCLALFDQAIDRGFSPQILNIGGGFRINYLSEEQDWHRYVSALKEAVLGTGRPPLTWQGETFGLSAEQGKLTGQFNSYPYWDPLPGAKFLDEILSAPLPSRGEETVAEVLRSNGLELWLEPGRAVLDQCGITLARVNSIRTATGGEKLVILEMNGTGIRFLDGEVFVDPVILYQSPPEPSASANVPVFFAGNLCLERDLITRHLTFLPAPPRVGDPVAFINTAAYMMDFSAAQPIMQPVARKVTVFEKGGNLVWTLDELYSPLS